MIGNELKPLLIGGIFFPGAPPAIRAAMTRETRDRQVAVVILAAGQGTRMRSRMPKVLHAIGNAPMLHHVMRAAEALSPERMVVVGGHGAQAVEGRRDCRDAGAPARHRPCSAGSAGCAGRV